MISIGALAAAVVAMTSISPVSPGDSASAAATVERLHAALAAGDSAGALRLIAEDAVILESGDQESKSTYAAHHLGEDIAFAKAVKSERGAMSVKVSGNVAWVTSLSTSRGEFNGRSINSAGAELIVLARVSGRGATQGWKIRAIHWSSHRRT